MPTLKDEVFECMNNSVENNGVEDTRREPMLIAREILEYTTLDAFPRLESEEDYDTAAAQVAVHVVAWQKERGNV